MDPLEDAGRLLTGETVAARRLGSLTGARKNLQVRWVFFSVWKQERIFFFSPLTESEQSPEQLMFTGFPLKTKFTFQKLENLRKF